MTRNDVQHQAGNVVPPLPAEVGAPDCRADGQHGADRRWSGLGPTGQPIEIRPGAPHGAVQDPTSRCERLRMTTNSSNSRNRTLDYTWAVGVARSSDCAS